MWEVIQGLEFGYFLNVFVGMVVVMRYSFEMRLRETVSKDA